jgi:ribose/xylose/arabinose/galactoside ABC-type transport system permease subunit
MNRELNMKTADSVSRKEKGDRWKSLLLNQNSILILFIIVLAVVVTIINPNFRNPRNIVNILQQISVLGIVSAGMAMLLISGNIDISVGSQISTIGVVMAMIVQKLGNIPLAVVAPILLGATIGVVNGIVVVKSKVHSFIISLGFMVVYQGLALFLSHGTAFLMSGKLEFLGRGRIFGYLPVMVLVFFAVVALTHVILRYTKYGRILYAIGGNRTAAYVSGIRTERYIIMAYTVVGTLCGLAALILISQLGAAYPNTGTGYAMDTLAAVILGGTLITGGKGSALGLLLGVVIFGMISNALNVLNVSAYLRDVVLGLIIISAVTIGRISTERQ